MLIFLLFRSQRCVLFVSVQLRTLAVMPWSIRGPPWRAARSLWGEAYRDAFPKGLHLGAVTVALDPSAGMNLAAMVAIAVAMFAVMPCVRPKPTEDITSSCRRTVCRV